MICRDEKAVIMERLVHFKKEAGHLRHLHGNIQHTLEETSSSLTVLRQQCIQKCISYQDQRNKGTE